MRTVLGYAVVLLGILLAANRLQTPAPLPVTAPAQSFSAERAMVDDRIIAARAHPVLSAAHDEVRTYIFDRLAQMGLSPALHPGRGVLDLYPGYVGAARVTNIVGVLSGRNRALPALLLMAHYDTVPNSPGAADDTAGVVSLLEVARALRAGSQPARDVIFLFTDGEELDLLGAAAFFADDPLARRIGPVINLEARGDSGLAAMFETGPRNDGTIAAFGAAVTRPSANSLSRFVYRVMPNSTDFTLALRQGRPGINIAFIGDESAYHTPLSTPDHLDRGSLQHMGDQALAAARSFAAVMPAQHRDVVYSDVLGFFFIHYAFWIGWLVLGVAVGLAICAIWRSGRETSYAWARGAAGAVLLLLAPALVLWSAPCAFDGLNHFQRLHHLGFLLAGAAGLVIGTVALATAAVEQSRGRWIVIGAAAAVALGANLCGFNLVAIGLAVAVALLAWFAARDATRPAALWHATLILLLLFAAIAQAWAPEIAFVFAWPALVAAIVAFVRTHLPRGHWAGGLLAMVAAVLVVAMGAMGGAFLFIAVGVDMPVALIVMAFPVLPAMLLVPGPHRLPLWAHGAVFLAGVALFAFGRYAPPDAAHPIPSTVRFVQDLDSGKAYRVAGFPALDDWSRAALGDTARHAALPWSQGRKQWWAPAKPATVPASTIEIRRDGARMVITVRAPAGADEAELRIHPAQPLDNAQLDGRNLHNQFAANSNSGLHVYGPDPRGFTFSFAPRGRGKIELTLLTTSRHWPQGVPPLPPLPKGIMAFDDTGSIQTVMQRQLSW